MTTLERLQELQFIMKRGFWTDKEILERLIEILIIAEANRANL